MALLRRHGLSRTAARCVERLGRTFLPGTRRRGVEYAALVDIAGRPLGDPVTGRIDETDLRPLFRRISDPAAQYVQVHSHPTSTAFSDRDGLVLLDHAALTVMAVIGADGTWFVLSKGPTAGAQGRQSLERLFGAFWDEFERLQPHFAGLVSAAGKDDAWARRLLIHAIWAGFPGAPGYAAERGHRGRVGASL